MDRDWPCDNYTEPVTCLSAKVSKTATCRICRIRAADRFFIALAQPVCTGDHEPLIRQAKAEALAEVERAIVRVCDSTEWYCTDSHTWQGGGRLRSRLLAEVRAAIDAAQVSDTGEERTDG